MPDLDEGRQELAAEWVLGTLDATERREAERLRASDPDFDAAIRAHERRLAPLLVATPPVEPPPGLEQRVMTALAALVGDGRGEVVDLTRRLRRWRGAAAGFASLAAGLAIAFVVPREAPAPRGSFVAVLQSPGVDPAYVAQVDLDAGTVSVRRVGAPTTAAKSHELWVLGGGRPAPVSLGVVDASARIPIEKLGGRAGSHLDTSSFAITLEPAGGSPTGAPTGPLLWQGKLTPTQ
jgi:anti-sigma-K factor RskA